MWVLVLTAPFQVGIARPLKHFTVLGTFARVTTAPLLKGARHGIPIGLATLRVPRSRLPCRHSPTVCECSTGRLNPKRALPSLASAGTERSPDLPSNCSSLRDLNCTHSNYKTQKSPVSVFIVTTSPCRDWVICAPAAFLGCGSRFSGSLSGIEP